MAFDLLLCLYCKHDNGFQSNRNCTNFSRYDDLHVSREDQFSRFHIFSVIFIC